MARHPLDPLSSEEIRAAAAAARSYEEQPAAPLRFNSISLQAPPTNWVAEATVDLSSGPKPAVSSWKQIEGQQPMLTPDDCDDAEAIAKADAGVCALLKGRGITNMDLVACDPWSVHCPPKDVSGASRLIQTFMYLHGRDPADNAYSRPLDFTPVVDLNARKVVKIETPHGKAGPPLPDTDCNYHRVLVAAERPFRTDLKPLNVVQPEGPSFKVDGRHISWQKWDFRITFDHKEGLVLHDVAYKDAGKRRPVMHRGSLVEMIVPYGDPNPPFERKCALDIGDYGLGYCANSLELGCDCLGAIQYFDAMLANSKGEPYTIKKAVCMHEEDAGTLWKHTEYRTGHAEVRRARRLVLSFVATVVNYEYKFIWSFTQDGSIHYDIQLTGELSTSLLSPGEGNQPRWGTLVAPRVNAQVHQHMFCARLDMAVDDPDGGKGLLVSEVDMEAMEEGESNPHGNGFWAVETPLETESAAQRMCNPAAARVWKISNPAVTHAVTGKPVAYKLVPPASPTLLAKPSSSIVARGSFATKNLWVTPHSQGEKFPAGAHTVMSRGGSGLPSWVKQDRDVGPGSDPVLWLCFGVSHLPRPEDFPVMPVETVGFAVKAFGFFHRGNDSVDIPHQPNIASTCCQARADAAGDRVALNGTAPNGGAAGNGTN